MLSTLQEADGPMHNSPFCLQNHYPVCVSSGLDRTTKGQAGFFPPIQQALSAKSPLQDVRDLEMRTEARRIQLDFQIPLGVC